MTKSMAKIKMKMPEGTRARELVRAAVAGILVLRGQICEHNQDKPKLTATEVKSWIWEGRR